MTIIKNVLRTLLKSLLKSNIKTQFVLVIPLLHLFTMSIKFRNENRVWRNLLSHMEQRIVFLRKCADNNLSNPVIDENCNQYRVWKDLCIIKYNLYEWLEYIYHTIPSIAILKVGKIICNLENSDENDWKKIFNFYKSWIKYTNFHTLNKVSISDEVSFTNIQILSSATWGGNLIYSTNAAGIFLKPHNFNGDPIEFRNEDTDFVKDLTFWNVNADLKLIIGITSDNSQLICWNLESGQIVGADAFDNRHHIFSMNKSFLFLITNHLEITAVKFIIDLEGVFDEVIVQDTIIVNLPRKFNSFGFEIIEISTNAEIVSIVRRRNKIFKVVQLKIIFNDPEDDESFYFSVFNIKRYSLPDVDENTPIKCHVALSKFLLLSFGSILFVHLIEEPNTNQRKKTSRWEYDRIITSIKMFIDVILLGFENGKLGIQRFKYVNNRKVVRINYIELQVDDHAIKNILIDTIDDKPYIFVESDYNIRRLLIPGY
ncbi:GSCOCG00005751001-RA-CDS [Cotesia congregata]|nr:GSCOCG00005751001-RA-CDS [Cotesia congregata]